MIGAAVGQLFNIDTNKLVQIVTVILVVQSFMLLFIFSIIYKCVFHMTFLSSGKCS